MVAGLSFTTTERGKLQRLMNAATKAHNAAHKADRALNAYCDAVWGFAPGDRDLDQIIDHCFGGCGVSPHGCKGVHLTDGGNGRS